MIPVIAAGRRIDQVELWASRADGPTGDVPAALVRQVKELIEKFGAEVVVQVAVLESKILPTAGDRP